MDRDTLAADLEQVKSGALSSDDFIRRYSASRGDPLVDSVLAGFYHFAADEDLRIKDQVYAEMQLSELSRMIQLLRSGGRPADVERISFLKESA